jgi:hypothetical protein
MGGGGDYWLFLSHTGFVLVLKLLGLELNKITTFIGEAVKDLLHCTLQCYKSGKTKI